MGTNRVELISQYVERPTSIEEALSALGQIVEFTPGETKSYESLVRYACGLDVISQAERDSLIRQIGGLRELAPVHRFAVMLWIFRLYMFAIHHEITIFGFRSFKS
jgi:hypothetical protein